MKYLLVMFAVLALVACQSPETKNGPGTSPQPGSSVPRDLCYLGLAGKDTTAVHLTINPDGTVTGTYVWIPWEKDGARGTLKGHKQGDLLTLLYDYTIEGSNQQEEKVMKLTGDLMAEAEGELVDGEGGVLKIKEGAKLNWRPFGKVECP